MGLNKSTGNMYNHKLPNIDILKNEYFDKKMSTVDIAKKYNVTTGAVLLRFSRKKIKIRSIVESLVLKGNYANISDNLVNFLNGLLLGDGSVVFAGRKKSCWYAHTDKNKEYLTWLVNEFYKFGIECSKIIPSHNNAWQVRTKSYRNFVDIRNKWYPNGKKIIPDIELKPITLFNWYIGDGSYDKKSISHKVVICSQFDQFGKYVMSNKLIELGIKNSVYSNMIYIKSESRKEFFKYIKSCMFKIPKCYLYKFN